ncbi:MAG: oligoendopeptidase F [Erysipelotrichaceae bacterium]
MNRHEIEEQYTWNLNAMFQDQQDFETMYEHATQLLQRLSEQQATYCSSELAFYDFFCDYEAFSRKETHLYVYAKMCNDVEPTLEENQKNLARVLTLGQNSGVALSFLKNSVIANKDTISSYLKSERCQDFTFIIEEILRTIPHRLSEQQETLMAQMSDILNNPSETYASWRMEFEDVIVDGQPEFLNMATFRRLLEHQDPKVRKQAYTNFFGAYEKVANPMSNLLIGNAKAQAFVAKQRKFSSALAASLFEDNANETLFYKVLTMANETYISNFHRYNRLKKSLLGLETLHYYDLNVSLVDSVDTKYSIEDAFTILEQALAPLSSDYLAQLKRAKSERWIDFLTHPGKRPGAYSWGSYDSYPYILMNYTNSYDSLSTLAHELGHSMHSHYSKTNNRPILANYKIFVAEVASTVNEILLNRHLIQTTTDPKYKAFLLYNLLEQLVGTLYRQPMYANFEATLHQWVEEGKPVAASDCTQLYAELSKDYYGPDVTLDSLVGNGCFYIPHFYYNFYVYKYTLGMSCALSFAKKILAGDNQPYLNFLTRGGSCDPIKQLQDAGVDPCADEVYDDAFGFFLETLNEFEAIMKTL